MGGSAAEAPTTPEIEVPIPLDAPGTRASDEEREAAVGELREHFVDGRLSHDTFLYRVGAALGARRRPDLSSLFGDLPERRSPGGLLPGGLLSPGWAGSLVNRILGGRKVANRAIRPRAVLPFPRGAGTTFSIGRDAACDLAIDDLTVSRVHARLERTPDGWALIDLGSTNGTRVNGWLARGQVPVRAGDLLRFGETEYTLGDDTRADESA